MIKTACFFSNEPLEAIEQEQYSLQDINILKDLGFNVVVANSFSTIPLGCDLYFSWWASGSILPLIKAKFCSKPIIVVAGGNEATLYKDSVSGIPAGYLASPWYKKMASYLSLRFASKVLVVSNFMKNDSIKLGASNPIVVHNSVNVEKFHISNKRREFVTIIFKSDKSVVRLKRGEVFIRSIPNVLKKYPGQKFVIIGNKGDYYSYLKDLCKELQIEENIDFIGGIKNEEVVDWMQRSLAYVQISDTETFGVAIAEAMCCGTHVVVSNKGAIPEVAGEKAVYVDHNDPNSVAEGIIKTLAYKANEYEIKGAALRDRIVEYFSYDLRKGKVESIIKQLL
jgi:glycosyltransferase involved in cell wall biosynthesis